MTNYKKDYELYVEKQTLRKIQTADNMINEVIDSKKCLGFQTWIHNKITEMVNLLELAQTEDVKKQDIKQFAVAFNLFSLNIKKFHNSFEMTLTDSFESNYNLLRIIFESTMFLFYIYTHPNEIDEIIQFFKDRYDVLKNPLPRSKNCTDDQLKTKDRLDKYSPANIRKALFVGKQLESMKSIHALLSVQSHPNVISINGNHLEYSKNRVKDCFWYVKLLSFYNLYGFLNNLPITQNIASKIFELPNFQKDLQDLLETASQDGTIGDFFPNHPDLPKPMIGIGDV